MIRIMNSKARLLIGIVAAVTSLIPCPQIAAGGKQLIPLKDLKQLLDVAKQIESASTLLRQNSFQSTDPARRELYYLFARESKGTICSDHYQMIEKLATDYKVKAHEFVDDMTSGANNWFKNVITLGGALGAMKNIGKSDQQLSWITTRYESETKRNRKAVTHDDVDCDMLKYQIRSLKDIVFVLQTDIRHLIAGEAQIINRAIYEKLKADKYIASANFYQVQELNEKQQQLTLNYFASRIDPETITVGEAVDHFLLKSLTIGRLLESCNSLGSYGETWHQLQTDYLEVCPRSRSDPESSLFATQFKLEHFKDTITFCESLLEEL